MIKTKNPKRLSFTPLRYPGGKTFLTSFFSDVIVAHGWKDIVYIEPYAGGAGAALALLMLEKVDRIIINDYDPAIYAFWNSVVDKSDAFIHLLNTTPTTVEEWEKQKVTYKAADTSDLLSLGFATFFLNRTNRSGILNAGPIGGKAQTGDWKIDARYNKSSLVDKIKLIALYKERITVENDDGAAIVKKYGDDQTSFFYVDPPYFVKGAELYLNAFKQSDHQKLASVLNEFADSKWLLSYDNEQAIVDLYPNFEHEVFSLNYSANHNTRSGDELMIFSNAVNGKIIYESN